MSEISVGQKAPSFRLPAAQGPEVGPEDYLGRSNLILFFAKGMACGFCRQTMSQLARGLPRFRALETRIIMITPTTLDRGRWYARNFELPFPYLCDPEYRVYAAYGLRVRPHSLAWKARTLFHDLRLSQPDSDFGPAKPALREIPLLLNDDDLGFFILDRDGAVRYTTQAPYVVFDGGRPTGVQPIPSNDEIVTELERFQGRDATRASA